MSACEIFFLLLRSPSQMKLLKLKSQPSLMFEFSSTRINQPLSFLFNSFNYSSHKSCDFINRGAWFQLQFRREFIFYVFCLADLHKANVESYSWIRSRWVLIPALEFAEGRVKKSERERRKQDYLNKGKASKSEKLALQAFVDELPDQDCWKP